ncbi:hypothetical protein [Catellatospora chokoriensis]|uniref:Uncharacterized protein n=1 Tax=Catellatospora chokoriensis TaxID=310353 RepID=A0A8J3NRT9_9ACTN|nr:hypothetical protein [Catellatospora chokoriensis]GIF90522.1 hypothetical protein Cch02nite_39660 [Catellatospora chokoriensis]
MIRRLCHAFLASAARRWPAELRGEMLAEWRAELHAIPTPARRLRYAASLASSRPHREPALVVSPGRNLAHLVLSFVLVVGLPWVYGRFSLGWTTSVSDDTIGWQAWAGVGGIVGAVALGIICARATTGVTQLIRPAFVPLWTVGIMYTMLLAGPLLEGHLPNRSHAISHSWWALSAVVLCTLAGRVARRGSVLLSWGVVMLAVAVSLTVVDSSIHHLDAGGFESFFDGEFLPGFLFLVVTRISLHDTVFLLVYAHCLVRRHRAAEHRLTTQAMLV